MMRPMKAFLLKVTTNQKLVTWATVALAGQLVALGVSAGLPITPEMAYMAAGGISALAIASIEAWAGKTNAAGVKVIQTELKHLKPGIRVDGIAGPFTQGATASVVDDAKKD